MLTVELEPDTEKRVAACARSRGVSQADLIRALIEEGLDDLDDVRMAAERLSQPRQPLTGAEARQALGLED